MIARVIIARVIGRTGLTWLLIGLCLLLGAEAYRQVAGPSPPLLARASPGPSAPHLPPAADAERVSIPPLESLTETLERPLFRPNRQPPELAAEARAEPAAMSAKPPPVKSNAVLLGTIVSAGQSRALIRLGGKKRLAWVQEGHSIDGWRVVAILPDRITLRQGAAADQLRLARKSPVPSTPRSK